MSPLRYAYRIGDHHERELAERLRRAEERREPVVLGIPGARYRLVPHTDDNGVRLADEDEPFAKHDPEAVRAAIEAGAGALAGIDVEAFLEEILEERIQDMPGHRF